MIWNIIDCRERPYRWKSVNAIVESVEHDNCCTDADEAPESEPDKVVDYDEREGVSVEEAVRWASQQRCPVTLYLYDAGKGATNAGHSNAAGDSRL